MIYDNSRAHSKQKKFTPLRGALFFGGDEGSCRAASGKMSTRTFFLSSFSTRSFQAKKFTPLRGALFLVEMRGVEPLSNVLSICDSSSVVCYFIFL